MSDVSGFFLIKKKKKRAMRERMGITRQAINKWLRDNKVPYKRLLQVEQATGIPRHELAPELFEGYERKEGA